MIRKTANFGTKVATLDQALETPVPKLIDASGMRSPVMQPCWHGSGCSLADESAVVGWRYAAACPAPEAAVPSMAARCRPGAGRHRGLSEGSAAVAAPAGVHVGFVDLLLADLLADLVLLGDGLGPQPHPLDRDGFLLHHGPFGAQSDL